MPAMFELDDEAETAFDDEMESSSTPEVGGKRVDSEVEVRDGLDVGLGRGGIVADERLGERGTDPREREEDEGRRLIEKLVAETAGEEGAMRSVVSIERRFRRLMSLGRRRTHQSELHQIVPWISPFYKEAKADALLSVCIVQAGDVDEAPLSRAPIEQEKID
jgi:hypothetical protein